MRVKTKNVIKAALLLSFFSVVYYYVILNRDTHHYKDRNKQDFFDFEDVENKNQVIFTNHDPLVGCIA